MTDAPTEPPRAVRPLVAAGGLFLDKEDRVLLVRPTYKPDWDIPGGYVETGESPRDACQREIYEELGLKINVGRLLTVDWAPHPDQGDKLLLVFDCGRLNNHQIASINYRDGEIAEHAFLHVIEVEDKAMPRLRRRVRASLIALANERFAYLEHGEVPTRTDRQRLGFPSGPGIA